MSASTEYGDHETVLYKPLKLNGFSGEYYGGLRYLSLASNSFEEQYREFYERVKQAIGKRFLPIYRMADGEFSFLVGWRPPALGLKGGIDRRLYWWARSNRSKLGWKSVTTCWGEKYTGWSGIKAHRIMRDGLTWISRAGILAAYFAKREDRWGEEYVDPVRRWLRNNSIIIHSLNYVPFYFVYALHGGKSPRKLMRGTRVLVVTSANKVKRRKLAHGILKETKADDVQFLNISHEKSMFDVIDADEHAGKVDIALVGAGIGAINILRQLEPLGIPAIDAGIALECFADPQKRSTRPFLQAKSI